MNRRDLKVRQTMARVARVRDQRAAAHLSAAMAAEQSHREARDRVAKSRDDVRVAGDRCLTQNTGVDLARYALLSDLQAVLDTHVARAEHLLASAVAEREQRRSERLVTKSRYERAAEEAARYRHAMHQEIDKKQTDQSVELWLMNGGHRD